jgi:hypothetical protein
MLIGAFHDSVTGPADLSRKIELVVGYIALSVLLGVSLALEPIAISRCRRTIRDWAAVSGLQLTSVTRRWVALGPYRWRGSRWSRVFAVEALDHSGVRRVGFARVSGGFGGLVADEVEVRVDGT